MIRSLLACLACVATSFVVPPSRRLRGAAELNNICICIDAASSCRRRAPLPASAAGDGDSDSDSNDDGGNAWTSREDWALLDCVGRYTVSNGDVVNTFWLQLVVSTPELSLRTAEEAEARQGELLRRGESSQPCGPRPLVIENWRREGGGRIVGTLDDGVRRGVVAVTAEMEGRLPAIGSVDSVAADGSDVLDGPGAYIVALGGKIYELGSPDAAQSSAYNQKKNYDAAVAAVAQAGGNGNGNGNGKSNGNGKDLGIMGLGSGLGGVLQGVLKSNVVVASGAAALVAVSILSGVIGYAAGSSSQSASYGAARLEPTVTIYRTRTVQNIGTGDDRVVRSTTKTVKQVTGEPPIVRTVQRDRKVSSQSSAEIAPPFFDTLGSSNSNSNSNSNGK